MGGSIADLKGIVESTKLLRAGLDEGYTRIRHEDFHRVFYPLLASTEPGVDLSPIVYLAKNPMSPIIVTDDDGMEIYRVPPLWNTNNLNRVSRGRSDSISAVVDRAMMKANSGTVPPSHADSYVINSFAHLVNHVEVSEEHRKAWQTVLDFNQSPDVSKGQNKTVPKVAHEQKIELNGEYEDL